MIDVSEDVVSAPQQSRRRSSGNADGAQRAGRNDSISKKLAFERVFSDTEKDPFQKMQREGRTAEITDDAGKVIFKQENVEVPKAWSVLATKVVVSKYFYGEQGTPERETSAPRLIH